MSTGSTFDLGRGAVLSALLLVGAPQPGPAPLRLAIYYGYPSLVNGSRGDLAKAVAQFSSYDLLVLGDGLEFDTAVNGHAGPAEHAFTTQLIQQLHLTPRHPEIYGYIDLGMTQRLSSDDVVERIDRWVEMGVDGVFLDEAGYDFGVTREQQNAAVAAAHNRGIAACLNAFRPGDVFNEAPEPLNAVGGGNPYGVRPLIGPHDAVLLESFAIGSGIAEPASALTARVSTALLGRHRFGTRIFGIATAGRREDEAALAQYGWWMASLFGLDAYGWAEPGYSAVFSQLPSVGRPAPEAALQWAAYIGEARVSGPMWRRPTTAGVITVDLTSLRGTLAPR